MLAYKSVCRIFICTKIFVITLDNIFNLKSEPNMERIATRDLFKSASLMCLGVSLSEIRPDDHGVNFILTGDTAFNLEDDYAQGKLQLNPLTLKQYLDQLRQLVRTQRNQAHDRHPRS
jgi:hypothetical protein